MSKKEKFALYLTPEKKARLERRYQEDGSRSITGFIERAIDFYLDYPYGFGSNLTVFTVTDLERISEKAVANWEHSPGHLATMIDPNCDAVGVGVTISNGKAFCYMFVGNPTTHNPYA